MSMLGMVRQLKQRESDGGGRGRGRPQSRSVGWFDEEDEDEQLRSEDQKEAKEEELRSRVDRAVAAVSVLFDGRRELGRLLLANPAHAQRLLQQAMLYGEKERQPAFSHSQSQSEPSL